jgi:hypothetical protein
MSFDQRIRKAHEFECTVLDALRVRGWTAELFGQGQLFEDVRAILRQVKTPVRWMADIIGCKKFAARTLTVFVDAKAGELWRRTNKHDVEQSAAESAHRWAEFSNCPVYFVFTDWSVTIPATVLELDERGPDYGNGSGMPFLLVPRIACTTFDAIFGPVNDVVKDS